MKTAATAQPRMCFVYKRKGHLCRRFFAPSILIITWECTQKNLPPTFRHLLNLCTHNLNELLPFGASKKATASSFPFESQKKNQVCRILHSVYKILIICVIKHNCPSKPKKSHAHLPKPSFSFLLFHPRVRCQPGNNNKRTETQKRNRKPTNPKIEPKNRNRRNRKPKRRNDEESGLRLRVQDPREAGVCQGLGEQLQGPRLSCGWADGCFGRFVKANGEVGQKENPEQAMFCGSFFLTWYFWPTAKCFLFWEGKGGFIQPMCFFGGVLKPMCVFFGGRVYKANVFGGWGLFFFLRFFSGAMQTNVRVCFLWGGGWICLRLFFLLVGLQELVFVNFEKGGLRKVLLLYVDVFSASNKKEAH